MQVWRYFRFCQFSDRLNSQCAKEFSIKVSRFVRSSPFEIRAPSLGGCFVEIVSLSQKGFYFVIVSTPFRQRLHRRFEVRFKRTNKTVAEHGDHEKLHVSASKDSLLGFSLKHLSESEQFRFGVAFQGALAMVTGLRFVVIDRADVLDKEKRKMLTSLLMNSKLDQAIVLATSEEVPPSIVPQCVKFLSLGEKTTPDEAPVLTAA